MSSSNCMFAVTLLGLFLGVSSQLMANTGHWVDNAKCAHGFLHGTSLRGVSKFAARQKCKKVCVDYGHPCRYAEMRHYSHADFGSCYLYSHKCGDYNNNYNKYYKVWVRDELHPNPATQCPAIRFPDSADAKKCWSSDGSWCTNNKFPASNWGRWICQNCASCVPRGGTWSSRVESAIGNIDDPVESAIGDIEKPHKLARSMNAFQKEEVIGFLSQNRSVWMGILAIVGLLAIMRSIYSVCTRKAGETYQEV